MIDDVGETGGQGGQGVPGIIRAYGGASPEHRAAVVAHMRDPATLLQQPAEARAVTEALAAVIELIDVAADAGHSPEELIGLIDDRVAEEVRTNFRSIVGDREDED